MINNDVRDEVRHLDATITIGVKLIKMPAVNCLIDHDLTSAINETQILHLGARGWFRK